MTPERIAELRALCDAATPGPWYVNRIKGYPDNQIETTDSHTSPGSLGVTWWLQRAWAPAT